MAHQDSPPPEWAPLSDVETRRFRCEVLEEDVTEVAAEGEPRLALMANSAGEARLLILVPPDQIAAVRKELFDRGYRSGLACVGRRGGYGSWRAFLNELEVAHIVVEMLGWDLAPEEQRVLDSIDAYGRTAPGRFTSPRLK